jgi:hypothetical protein
MDFQVETKQRYVLLNGVQRDVEDFGEVLLLVALAHVDYDSLSSQQNFCQHSM